MSFSDLLGNDFLDHFDTSEQTFNFCTFDFGGILFLRRHEGGEGGSPKCLHFSTWGEGGSENYLRRKVLTKISPPKPKQNHPKPSVLENINANYLCGQILGKKSKKVYFFKIFFFCFKGGGVSKMST